MTRHDIASIGVRLAAVFAVLLSVEAFATSLSTAARYAASASSAYAAPIPTPWLSIAILFVPPAAMLVCALVLWLSGNMVSHFVAGGTSWREEPQGFRLSASDAVSLLISALGLYLIVTGLMPLLSTLGLSLLSATQRTNGNLGLPNTSLFMPQILSYVSSLGAGLVLVFGARRIAERLPTVRAIEERRALEAQGQDLQGQASQSQASQTLLPALDEASAPSESPRPTIHSGPSS